MAKGTTPTNHLLDLFQTLEHPKTILGNRAWFCGCSTLLTFAHVHRWESLVCGSKVIPATCTCLIWPRRPRMALWRRGWWDTGSIPSVFLTVFPWAPAVSSALVLRRSDARRAVLGKMFTTPLSWSLSVGGIPEIFPSQVVPVPCHNIRKCSHLAIPSIFYL